MITDKDVKKLKNVFATKEDLEKMKNVFATKEDVQIIMNEIHTVIEVIGDVSEKLEKRLTEDEDTLDNHERRLDKVEDKVFAT